VADETPPPDAAPEPAPRKRGRVVALAKPKPPVYHEAVDTLRELLERAEQGEIAELVVVYAEPDGATGYHRTTVSYLSAMAGELGFVRDELSEIARSE
jgi:hypothetical protein